MEFWVSQESLTSLQWFFRAVIGFFILLFVVKLMGQRSISQLRLLDFVVVMLLGNILAHPLSDSELGLKGSFITVVAVALLYVTLLLAILKNPKIRHYFNPSPMPLIKNGEIIFQNLNKARITIDLLLVELRKEKVDDAKKVALALWEPGGTISVFVYPQFEQATRQDLHITPKPFNFPRPIIKEGTVDIHELNILGKDIQWLRHSLYTQFKVSPEEILLATLDENDSVKVFIKPTVK
ncbi:DUF421 domain-containing protein [Bacillus carboniphilus]|uniref:DUF421 domain-containing protein n=1 Tax=Bacillus carboniphilus TaxID=86663 RepID=A0ABP3FTE6_9BACI